MQSEGGPDHVTGLPFVNQTGLFVHQPETEEQGLSPKQILCLRGWPSRHGVSTAFGFWIEDETSLGNILDTG